MGGKKCSICGLWNPPSAMRCDCGFDFIQKSVETSFADPGTLTAAKDRAEKNLPTIVVRGVVFIAIYAVIVFAMYFAFGEQPRGTMLGIAFGIAGAASALVKIRLKEWI